MPPVSAEYRASCIPFPTGCRQCGTAIPDRRAYCSAACSDAFQEQHFWNTARPAALRRARPFGPALQPTWRDEVVWFGAPICARCFAPAARRNRVGIWFAAEVNHIVPVNGLSRTFGCCNHQENLEVLCHDCHVQVGVEQRAASLIGKPRPPTLFDTESIRLG